jgi:hypothetical protein
MVACVVMGWIVGEILLLKQPSAPHWPQILFFAVRLVMAMLGLMVWRAWRRRSSRLGTTARIKRVRYREVRDRSARPSIS